jgi:hypothetical protein
MTTITFDTLAFSKKLKKAGVHEKQAEAQVEIIAGMMTETISKNFATKHDLHTEIGKLKTEFKKDISDLTLKIGVMIAGSVTATVALLTLVLKLASLI